MGRNALHSKSFENFECDPSTFHRPTRFVQFAALKIYSVKNAIALRMRKRIYFQPKCKGWLCL